MSIERWTVRGPGGGEVGQIKKLVIDSTTREIAYADVLLFNEGTTQIFPWNQFEVTSDAIVLHDAAVERTTSDDRPDDGRADGPPLIETHTPVLGKVRPYPRRRVN